MLDQQLLERLAMRWVQKYITAFGGDPSKVTMYVQTRSACWDHLTTLSVGAEARAPYRRPYTCSRMEATTKVSFAALS